MLNKRNVFLLLASIAMLLVSYTLFPWLVFVALTPLLALYSELKKRSCPFTVITLIIGVIFFAVYPLLSFFFPEIHLLAAAGFALLISIAFGFFALSDNIVPNRMGLVTLVVYYTAFEYLALRWDPSLSDFLLGSTLGDFPELHRWSGSTGLTGVTAWILLGNILFYPILFNAAKSRASRLILLLYSILILAVPIFVSLAISSEGLTASEAAEEMIQHNSNPESYPAEIFGRTCAWVAVFLLLYALVNLRIKKR